MVILFDCLFAIRDIFLERYLETKSLIDHAIG